MALFKIEVGGERSGDTLTVEADNAAAAQAQAAQHDLVRENGWQVLAVYELVVGQPAPEQGEVVPDMLPDDADPDAEDAVQHTEPADEPTA